MARKPKAKKKKAGLHTKPIRGIPNPKKEAFLAAFRITGQVQRSADAAGIHIDTHYEWRSKDPEYRANFEAAGKDAVVTLRDEAIRRARDGVQRLKFYEGNVICIPLVRDGKTVFDEDGSPVMVPYIEHEYSDTLLIFTLKHLDRETFGESTAIVPGSGSETVRVVIDFGGLTDDQRRRLAVLSAGAPRSLPMVDQDGKTV